MTEQQPKISSNGIVKPLDQLDGSNKKPTYIEEILIRQGAEPTFENVQNIKEILGNIGQHKS